MRFEEFILLPEIQQDVELLSASFVMRLITDQGSRSLYMLHDFYIEKVRDEQGSLTDINAFEHEQLLLPYLEQINISELIS